jgi:hypothetical protein
MRPREGACSHGEHGHGVKHSGGKQQKPRREKRSPISPEASRKVLARRIAMTVAVYQKSNA